MKKEHENGQDERIRDEAKQVYERCAGALYAHLLYLMRSEATAQELLQETFIRFLLCRKRGKIIHYPYTYLHRVATRLAYKQMRHENVRRNREIDADDLEAPDDEWRTDTWSLIKKIWDRLKPKDKIVVKALVVDEMTPSEIVKHTGFTWGSVQRRVNKFKLLAQKLQIDRKNK